MLSRRTILQGIAAGAGTALGLGGSPLPLLASSSLTGASRLPKRIILFLQNQGFDPKTCIPTGVSGNCSLAGHTLPEPIQPLEPYKERLHIINGLHGQHTSPSHSAFFGALVGIVAVTAWHPADQRLIMNSARPCQKHFYPIFASAWIR